MIYARLKVRHFVAEAFGKPLGDLAKENAGFCERVKEPQRGVGPDVRAFVIFGPSIGNEIEHQIGVAGRCGDLVVRQVGDARQHVWVAVKQTYCNLLSQRYLPRCRRPRACRGPW